MYSAEYGRSSAGVVSVTLKSGSNDIHGVGYEFLRNQDLDAKNFFATQKSPSKRNRFGAAAGVRSSTTSCSSSAISKSAGFVRARRKSIQCRRSPNAKKQNAFFRYSSQTQDYGTVAAFPNILILGTGVKVVIRRAGSVGKGIETENLRRHRIATSKPESDFPKMGAGYWWQSYTSADY